MPLPIQSFLLFNFYLQDELRFSSAWICPYDGTEFREPSPALFSFNNPQGACPTCRGFGRTIEIDYERALPDRRLSIRGGVVKPWQSGMSLECQRDLLKHCGKEEHSRRQAVLRPRTVDAEIRHRGRTAQRLDAQRALGGGRLVRREGLFRVDGNEVLQNACARFSLALSRLQDLPGLSRRALSAGDAAV